MIIPFASAEELVAWDRDVAPFLHSLDFLDVQRKTGTAWPGPPGVYSVPIVVLRYSEKLSTGFWWDECHLPIPTRISSDTFFWLRERWYLMDMTIRLHVAPGDLLYLPTRTHHSRGCPPTQTALP